MEEEKQNEHEEQTEPAKVEQEQETEQTETEPEKLADIVNRVKSQYEEKMLKMEEAHKRDIAERDDLISQLLDSDNKTDSDNQSIADRINQKRNYKKW